MPPPRLTTSRGRMRLLEAASGLSALGDMLALTALLLRVHDSSRGSGLGVTVVTLAVSLPYLLAAPGAGALLDARETRRTVVLALLVQGVAAAALAADAGVGVTALLLVALTCADAVASPGISTLVPLVTGEDGATAGYARIQTARQLGTILGPVVGGVLVGAAGTGAALLVDAVSFAGLAAALAVLGVDRRPGAPVPMADGSASGLAGRAAGIRHLMHDPVLRLVTPSFALTLGAATGADVAFVFWARDDLHLGPAGYGASNALWPVGMVLTGLLLSRWTRDDRLGALLAVGGVVLGTGVVLCALSPDLALAALPLAAGGAGNALQNVGWSGLQRLRTPEPLRGRTFAAGRAIVQTAIGLSTVLGGVLVSVLGGRGALLATGGAGLAVAVVVAPVLVRLPGPARTAPSAPPPPAAPSPGSR